MANLNKRPSEVTRTTTHEGAPAYSPGVVDELLFTAVTTFFGENTFYEPADERERRLVQLVHDATRRDAKRTAEIIADTRGRYKIRTAALIMAVEYLRAGGPNARAVINSAIQRPDEPMEILAYWQTRYADESYTGGRPLSRLPWALRRGVADALNRQLTERNYLKYGHGKGKLVTMADAIELTHPKFGVWNPVAGDDTDLLGVEVWTPQPWKHELARYILDEAHHGDGIDRYIGRRQGSSESPELPMIYQSYQMGQLPENMRRNWLRNGGAQAVENSGYTWERLSGWLPGGMDAEAWEMAIPVMPVGALLKNLRNFDEAGISADAQNHVAAAITDDGMLTAARLFPYQVYQAYKAAPNDRWKPTLGITFDKAIANLPAFDRTLFLVDVSGSMCDTLSKRSEMTRYELAAVMGVAAAYGATNSTLSLFSDLSGQIELPKGASPLNVATTLLRDIETHLTQFLMYRPWAQRRASAWQGYPAKGRDVLYGLGQGTHLHGAIAREFNPDLHDRVVVFTDEQTMDDEKLSDHVPSVIYFNLAGYAPFTDWRKRRYHIGGFSDAAFGVAAALA